MTKFATIETNKGTMKAELYEKDAPKTVANFEKLANSGFYDGTKFHRVIKDFMVQGGDPYSKGGEHAKGPVGTGGPGYKIDCETQGNPHKHQVGALSMAHAGKNTGGSQFFIVLSEQNTKHLNGVHTVFGKVIEGLDVVPKINQNDTVTKARVSSEPGAEVMATKKKTDLSAALTGLVLGARHAFLLLTSIVMMTNAHYRGEGSGGGSAPVAGTRAHVHA